MPLYNMKENGSGYKITKFNDDLEPELDKDGQVKTYAVSASECSCPAGHRPTCRHRQMLPDFQNTGRVNTRWFLEFDNREWFFLDGKLGLMNERSVKRSWRRL